MKHTQRGLTLIEILGALAIGSMLLLGLTAMIDSSMSELKGQQAALHQAQVVRAANKYIAENYETLVTNTGGGNVVPVTVDNLKTANYLSAGFSAQNVYLQTVCVLVRQRPSPPASEPKKLDALVVTYGGRAIPDKELPVSAMHAGQGGGYISHANPAVARGASWELNTTPYRNISCDGTTVLNGTADHDGGHLASNLFYDGPGQLGTDFLYRNKVAGRPELNKMNTAILMDDGAVVDAGDDCRVGGVAEYALALDKDTRTALTCGADGKWRAASEWGLAVNTYSDLPTSGNRRGDVRMVKNISRAFTYDGATWVALAVDQNGDMDIPRQLTVDSIYASGGIHADDHISTDRDLNVADNVRIGGVLRGTNGILQIGGSASISENLGVSQNVSVAQNVSAQNVGVGNDLTVSRNANIGNDLEVGRDTTMQRNLTTKGDTFTNGLFIESWVTAPAYAVREAVFHPGDECHIYAGLDQNGRPTYIYPMGILVVDTNYVVMTCGPARKFIYANGLYTP